MAKQHYRRQRRGTTGPMLAALGVMVVLLAGVALILHATDVINIPFLSGGKQEVAKAPDRRGKVGVPIAVRPISAYSAISPAHIRRPKTNQVAMIWLPEQGLREDIIRDPGQLLGRVLRQDQLMGQVFLKQHLFPVGTNPGPTAGIPAGKRALRLSATDIAGLHGLKRGDRFDIVMTTQVEIEEPKERKSVAKLDVKGPYAPLVAASREPEPELPRIKRRRAEVKVIVQDGIIVQPIQARVAIGTKSNMFSGSRTTRKPIEELIIGLDPQEVTELNHAMAIGARLQVAMRSSRRTDSGERVEQGTIPDRSVDIEELLPPRKEVDPDEKAEVRVVEGIEGGKKRLQAVPAKGEGG